MGRIIDRRRVMGGKSLPYDAEIEYLQSTGTQYIDTQIAQNTAYRIEVCTFSVPKSECVIGVRTTSNIDEHSILYTQEGEIRFLAGGGTSNKNYVTDYPQNTWVTLIIDKSTCYINEDIYTGLAFRQITSNFTYTCFAMKTSKVVNPTSHKIKYVRFYNNGELILDFIPVRKGNIGYMYDKVSKQLFGNAGTGAFILGPDK